MGAMDDDIDDDIDDDDAIPAPPDNVFIESLLDAAAIVFAGIPGLGMIVNAFDLTVHRIWREKERRYFTSVIARLVERLDQHDERIDRLSAERAEGFLVAAVTTGDIAHTTTDPHKLLVLRNEAINSAMANAPSANLREIFFAMTRSLTGLHLCIFLFLAKPEKFGAPVPSWRELEHLTGDGPWETHTWDIIKTYVSGAPDNETIQHCLTDLVNQGVVAYKAEGALPGFMFPIPTNFGWSFYSFIIDEDAADELPLQR